ncbi:mechanosensitive ion channel family protein [uncultured Maritimibacter sp.]|jgi:small-conductance mechanosensitive channel|uniref:mechanosensitive ion channel family protein n=1 Tax=uncultured Maritimibacter sp. TaxID=991866 RepID=UPI000AB8A953|nr:mechanosensitive ion channel family protein [uncultured Maritimibacter sp.]
MGIFGTLALVLCLGAVVPFGTPLVAQDGTITTEDKVTQQETDAAIATRIRDILHELEGYDDVSVSVKAGIVTLRGTTLGVDSAERLTDLAQRVNGVVAVENEVTISTDVGRLLTPLYERFEARFWQAVAFLPLVGIAALAFCIVVWFAFFIAKRRRPWDNIAPNAFIADIIRALIQVAGVIGGIVIALDIIGATALLSTILGAAGIIGLAIGFAVRDTVENFIASVLLSVRQPFAPNDSVAIDGQEGKVIRLTSRATILLSFDGNHVRIPNQAVFKATIVNYSRNPERRFEFDIRVAWDTDLAVAKHLAEDTLNALPFILTTPSVAVWTTDLGGSDIGMRLTGWINQETTGLFAARSEAIRQTLIAFDAAGIEMPETTYRIMMNDVGQPLAEGAEIAQAAPEGPSTEVEDVAATQEHDLENIVSAERETRNDEDLLRKSAATE